MRSLLQSIDDTNKGEFTFWDSGRCTYPCRRKCWVSSMTCRNRHNLCYRKMFTTIHMLLKPTSLGFWEPSARGPSGSDQPRLVTSKCLRLVTSNTISLPSVNPAKMFFLMGAVHPPPQTGGQVGGGWWACQGGVLGMAPG